MVDPSHLRLWRRAVPGQGSAPRRHLPLRQRPLRMSAATLPATSTTL
ncbi:hypothetical protein GZL_04799 [Streptomyces sp. 769]|nr:hypothetical protein GZL_04799 [Streptomyces sp. 769]